MEEELGPVCYSSPPHSKIRLILQTAMLAILAVMLAILTIACILMSTTGKAKPGAIVIVAGVGAGAAVSFYFAYTHLMLILSPSMPVVSIHEKGLTLLPRRPRRPLAKPLVWRWEDFDQVITTGMPVRDLDGLQKRIVLTVSLTTRSGEQVKLPAMSNRADIPNMVEKLAGDVLLSERLGRFHQGQKLSFGNLTLDKHGLLGIPWSAFTGEYSYVYFAQNPGTRELQKRRGVERIIFYYLDGHGQRQDLVVPANTPNLYVFIKLIEQGTRRRFPLLYT